MKQAGWWSMMGTFLVLFLSLLAIAQEKAGGKRCALLVGINEYEHQTLKKLAWAENDVVELGEELGKKNAGYEVVLLKGSEATKKKIEGELKRLSRKCGKGDTLLVGLAGHGVQFEGEEESYFCPVEGRALKEASDSLVPLSSLYQELKVSGAGVQVLLVDACRNDPQRGRGRGIDGDTSPRPPRGVAALFSCGAGQRAWESDSLRHGVFFHYVLEAFRVSGKERRGRLTFYQLAEHVQTNVPLKVRALFGPQATQLPNLKADIEGGPPVLLEFAGMKPELLGAPFFAREAGSARRSWTTYLGVSELERNSIGMELVFIPPGKFQMGSPKEEEGRFDNEGPQHEVEITQGFYLAKYEVTRGQFRKYVEYTTYKTEAEADGLGGWGFDAQAGDFQGPKFNRGTGKLEGKGTSYSWLDTGFPQTDQHPVVNVTWNDAVAFCLWLSKKEGKKYRLPTEAEWEYCCRAGTATRYASGNDGEALAVFANVGDASAKRQFPKWETIAADDGYVFTAPVGQFKPNAFGLHDLHGNAWEWCQDWFGKDYYGESPRQDPQGPATGTFRVARGGSFGRTPSFCRSAHRGRDIPGYRYFNLGFRVACVR
jgi:formylglycine-generating enzyme required for sulfatase activity